MIWVLHWMNVYSWPEPACRNLLVQPGWEERQAEPSIAWQGVCTETRLRSEQLQKELFPLKGAGIRQRPSSIITLAAGCPTSVPEGCFLGMFLCLLAGCAARCRAVTSAWKKSLLWRMWGFTGRNCYLPQVTIQAMAEQRFSGQWTGRWKHRSRLSPAAQLVTAESSHTVSSLFWS